MKKITILLASLLLVFAAGCREDASLDGLESQTKEEGSSAADTPESAELKALLTYESGLEYNWVCDYAPAEGVVCTLLFDFLSDNSVASDSPVSDNEKNLALFTVSSSRDGGLAIRFDGQTMLNDACIEAPYRERQLFVESYDENTVRCRGAASGAEIILRKAASEDVLKLGEKLVWLALSKKNAMTGILRTDDGRFAARYAVDKQSRTLDFTWIDSSSKTAMHESAPFEVQSSDAQHVLSWTPCSVNGASFGALTYDIASATVAFDASGFSLEAPAAATPDFVNKASNQWYLGGSTRVGTAHPDLWNVLASDKFRTVYFYPYADDIPLRVEAFMADGSTGNYLFVNDYTTDPKTAHYDSEGDWVRFYKSTQGDYLKIPTGDENPDFTLSDMERELKPFTDFYFDAEGLYAVSEKDAKGTGFYLISKRSNLWVKVRSTRVSEPDGSEPPAEGDNCLPALVEQGMVPYGTFFENANKHFRLHYSLNVAEATADLIWITDTEEVYTDGNYQAMARNKAQYKTVKVSSNNDGEILFETPLTIGQTTYRGLTWSNSRYTPAVDGEECTIRTPMSNESHPLEYFYTYPAGKYEGGTKVFIPHSQLCLPTAADNIAGLTGTDRYLFYPYVQSGSSTPAGPCAIELFPADKGARVDLKSFSNGFTTSILSIAIDGYKVQGDRMIFTKGAVTGNFADQNGDAMSQADSESLAAPLVKLLFSPEGFHVYKAESVSYDNSKHYFFLVSPDPSYPYWIKIREA